MVRQAFAARRYSAAAPREAGRVHSPKGPVVLWASPAYGGGWCEGLQQPRLEFNRMSVSCIWPKRWMHRRIDVTGYLPFQYWGRVPQRGVASLHVRLGDGRSLSVPTRSGFFLFRVPDRVLAHTGPSGFRALDARGRVVASEKFVSTFPEALGLSAGGRPPGGADVSRKHRLVARPTSVGLASIWTAPSSLSPARCTWLQVGRGAFGGGCRRDAPPRRGLDDVAPLQLRVKGKPVRLLWGHAGNDVAQLEVLFQDGDKAMLAVTHGVFLYPVPSARWIAGHRPAFLVARNTAGRQLAKQLLYEFTLAPH